MCRTSSGLIDKIYNPIDAVNRFINLALQTIEENSQGRQFLLESKLGIRKASTLLKRLNNQTHKIERKIRDLAITHNESYADISSKRR